MVLQRATGEGIFQADDKKHTGDKIQSRGKSTHRQGDGTATFANFEHSRGGRSRYRRRSVDPRAQRTQARVSHLWPPPVSYPLDVDIVLSELLDDLPTRMPWTPGDFPVALCIVVREHTRLNMTALRDSTPHGTISLPLRRNDIAAALTVALEQLPV